MNVKVERGTNENTISLIRRFTKRVQGSGILPRMRKNRYYDRPLSKLLVKKRKLNYIKRKEERDELIKLGKISDQPIRKRFRRR